MERVFYEACQKVVNLRTQLLIAMANIATGSLNNRLSTPSQTHQNSSTSSIRLLAGSHMSSTNGASLTVTATTNAASVAAGLNGRAPANGGSLPSGSSPTNQITAASMAFFQANPHLLNSAALHSTHNSQSGQSQYTTPFTTPQGSLSGVFKEPQTVGQLQFGADKRSNNGRILNEANGNNKDNFLQVSLKNVSHSKLPSPNPI